MQIFGDFHRQTYFRENVNHKKIAKMEIDDIIMCVRQYELVNEMVLYSLSAL